MDRAISMCVWVPCFLIAQSRIILAPLLMSSDWLLNFEVLAFI